MAAQSYGSGNRPVMRVTAAPTGASAATHHTAMKTHREAGLIALHVRGFRERTVATSRSASRTPAKTAGHTPPSCLPSQLERPSTPEHRDDGKRGDREAVPLVKLEVRE